MNYWKKRKAGSTGTATDPIVGCLYNPAGHNVIIIGQDYARFMPQSIATYEDITLSQSRLDNTLLLSGCPQNATWTGGVSSVNLLKCFSGTLSKADQLFLELHAPEQSLDTTPPCLTHKNLRVEIESLKLSKVQWKCSTTVYLV